MALNIENATVGFDANNIQMALNNLNTKVINDTIGFMNSKMSELCEWVDSAWVGASAETFKANMEADKEVVIKNLKDTYDVLKSEMYQIVNELQAADEALVQRRNQ